MNTSPGTSRLRAAACLLVVSVLVFAVAPDSAAEGSLQSCTAHCDCPQGEFCYKGNCIRDSKSPVYCCSKLGCKPGAWCITPEGTKNTCGESPDYSCETACDCGPAHACIDVPGVGKTCVKDEDDPWLPGDSIFGVEVPPGQPTYCCSDNRCYAGQSAYDSASPPMEFACFDPSAAVVRDYCGGKQCYFAGDCVPGESCVDTRRDSTASPGTSCSHEGGSCISNAIAEAVYGWYPNELMGGCASGCFTGQSCEVGWQSGGSHAVQRVVGICGSCGNNICEKWESPVTCPADCNCDDGVCSGTELLSGSCQADCGTCGDGICTSPETPKICPSDCPVTLGDGSCSTLEVESGDCGCPDSCSNWDFPGICGDGVCQVNGEIPENYFNCKQDCEETTPPVISYILDPATPDGNNGWYRSDVTLTWTVVEPESPDSLVKTGCVDQSITTDQDETTYSCSATSDGGLADAVEVTIKRDATPPVVLVTGMNDGDKYLLGEVPTAGCSTTDGLSGVFAEAIPSVTGGTSLGVGTFTAICTGAQDHAGNQTNDVLAIYSVVFDFAGFFQPVDNLNVMNKVKAGNAVPVKFSLAGNQGLGVFALGFPISVPMACESWAPSDMVEETVTAGGSSLSYDADQYLYVWKTNKAWGGTCRQLQVKLVDGETYKANFLFLK